MILKIQADIKNGGLVYLTVGLLFLLVFFSAGIDFLHNHEPDFQIHQDCPAHQLYILFNSILIFLLIVYFREIIFSYLLLWVYKRPFLQFTRVNNSRGPPFQIY